MPTQGYYYPLRNQLLSMTETHTFAQRRERSAFWLQPRKTYELSLGAGHTNYASTAFAFRTLPESL